jgi:alpha-galactosidase
MGYPAKVSANVRDLWAHKDLGAKSGSYSAEVPSHGVVMVTVKP